MENMKIKMNKAKAATVTITLDEDAAAMLKDLVTNYAELCEHQRVCLSEKDREFISDIILGLSGDEA